MKNIMHCQRIQHHFGLLCFYKCAWAWVYVQKNRKFVKFEQFWIKWISYCYDQDWRTDVGGNTHPPPSLICHLKWRRLQIQTMTYVARAQLNFRVRFHLARAHWSEYTLDIATIPKKIEARIDEFPSLSMQDFDIDLKLDGNWSLEWSCPRVRMM